VWRVKVQGQFGSDTVVPYNVGIFRNLKVKKSNRNRERNNVSLEFS
jgi:hypothetical protein